MSLQSFYHDYVMHLVDPFLYLQLRGVLVDQPARAELRAQLVAEQQAAAARLKPFAGDRPILGKKSISNTVLMKLLYGDLGLPVQYHPKTKRPTCNEDALTKLMSKVTDTQRAAFNDILTIRDLGTLISTFLDAPLDADVRYRSSYNLGGTETGRLSSSKSPWWSGGNAQNWSEAVRVTVVADPGHCFLYGDGEQAEARVVAWLAGDRAMMRMFSNPEIHPYKLFGSEIFGTTPDTLTTEQYDMTKRGIHGTHYGEGLRRLATTINKPQSVAKSFQDAYLLRFPAIKSVFQARVRQQVERTRTLVTPFGRRRTFFGRFGDDLFREGYAYVPQSAVADWLDIGLLRLWRASQWLGEPTGPTMALYLTIPHLVEFYRDHHLQIEPMIQIHDGLLCQVPVEQTQVALEFLKLCLTYPIPFENGPLTIPVDFKVGTCWGKLRKATPEVVEELRQ